MMHGIHSQIVYISFTVFRGEVQPLGCEVEGLGGKLPLHPHPQLKPGIGSEPTSVSDSQLPEFT